MTKARIRDIRAAAKKCGEGWMPSFEAMVVELINEVQYLQEFTRAGKIPELPHKANELPLAAKVNLKKRARGTLQELQSFAKEQNIPASDGEFLFHHFEGKGWKDVLDWKAHFRKWKSANWLPSQKGNNGKPVRQEAPGVTL